LVTKQGQTLVLGTGEARGPTIPKAGGVGGLWDGHVPQENPLGVLPASGKSECHGAAPEGGVEASRWPPFLTLFGQKEAKIGQPTPLGVPPFAPLLTGAGP